MMKTTPFVLAAALAAASVANSATPDAGTIQRQVGDRPLVPPQAAPAEVTAITPPAPASRQQGPAFELVGLRFEGNTLFPEAELMRLLQDLPGKPIDFAGLQAASRRIAEFYASHGYLANVWLPPQEVKDGVVVVRILECRLESVRVEMAPGMRYDAGRARSHVTRQLPEGSVLFVPRIEKGVLLLNQAAGVTTSATLEPGKAEGTAALVLKLLPAPLISGDVGLDNFGSRSTGEWRVNAGANLSNPFGQGDLLSARTLISEGSQYGRLSYNLPFGVSGGSMGAYASNLQYKLKGAFKALNASGTAFSGGVNWNQVLARTRTRSLVASAGYNFQSLTDEMFGAKISEKTIHGGTVDLFYDSFDSWMGGGSFSAGIGLVGGNLDLSGNAVDAAVDRATRKSQGTFAKLTFNASRTQNLPLAKTSLSLALSGQFASKNLDTSEKFSLGGPSGVRAYPSSEGNGDHGAVLTAELRRSLGRHWQAAGFIDAGWVQQNAERWATWDLTGPERDSYTLQGAGVWVAWARPGRWMIKGTVADRLGNNPGANPNGRDSDGTKSSPRAWLQATLLY